MDETSALFPIQLLFQLAFKKRNISEGAIDRVLERLTESSSSILPPSSPLYLLASTANGPAGRRRKEEEDQSAPFQN